MAELSCSKSEIDYFSPTPVQVALIDGRWQKFYPQNAITNVIEFNITGTENEVIDMNSTSLYMRGKIKKTNGTADLVAADDTLFPVNNMLHTIIKHVDVLVNGQLITRASRDYAYKAILMKLTQCEMPESALTKRGFWLEGFYPDDAADHHNFTANTTAKERMALIKRSREFELTGVPAIDLFGSDRALPMKCDLTLRIYLNDAVFYLLDGAAADARTADPKLVLSECYMRVRKVAVAPTFCKMIAEQRQTQDMTLNFTRREINVVNIPTGTSQLTRENLFRGTLGVRYFFAMVRATAYAGVVTECPFDFNPFTLSEISLTENGVHMGYGPLKVEMATGTNVAEAYRMFLEIIGAVGERPLSCPVTIETYKKGCTIFAFSRAPDLCHGEHQLPTQSGNLALQLNFSAATTHAISLICMAEYDSRIIIDKDNNVVTNYVI